MLGPVRNTLLKYRINNTRMTVDVDAVNERLNGLVNLLHVVGIEGVDPDALVEEQKRLAAQKKSESAHENRHSSDAQILEIIKKLQQAQADSPEILAALKSPELRALASLAAQKQGAAKPPEPSKKAPSLDDVMDEDDNYPKIGPGYSDDISVVSDLTTPTVMTKQQVAEEEYYKDVNGGPGALPPMHVGMGAAQPSRPSGALATPPTGVGGAYAPKTKNLVSQVSARPGATTRRAIAKTGGAAAQRRVNYQKAMAKLQSNEYGTGTGTKQDKSYMDNFSPKKPPTSFFPTTPSTTMHPSELPSIADSGKKSKNSRNKSISSKKGKKGAGLATQEVVDLDFGDTDPTASTSGSSSKAKGKDKEKLKDIDWGTAGTDTGGWPAFDDLQSGQGSKDAFGSPDDFFAADAFANGDPFANAAPPASAAAAPPPAPAPSKRSKSPKAAKKSREDGQSGQKTRKSRKDGESSSDKKKEKKKTKSRRSSLTMG